MNIKNFKKEIMNNKPTAIIDENGNIKLQISDEYYQILDNYCDEKKHKLKKELFK